MRRPNRPNIPTRHIFGLDYADGPDGMDIQPEQRASMKHLYWNGVAAELSGLVETIHLLKSPKMRGDYCAH